jgi:hypothetical protein
MIENGYFLHHLRSMRRLAGGLKTSYPTCAEWWKWVGNPWSDPAEEPSHLEEDENDEENKHREDEDEVEEEELEIDPDEPPY